MSFTQIDFLLTPFIYNGQPLVGGTAEFYESGTSTPYTVYADNLGNGGATTRSFESDGTLVAYSDGSSDMKIIIKDSSGATLQTYDGLFVDRVGDLTGKVSKTGDTMSGDLNMGANDITNGGNITVGDDKHFIADHGGSTASIHPDDALYIANTAGNNSIRGGSVLGLYDDATLALSLTSTDAVVTGDVTISALASNTDELLTLNVNGKILASGTTLTSINNSISSNTSNITSISGNYLPLTGGTLSGSLALGSNTITGVSNGSSAGDAVNKGQLNDLPTHSTCIQTTVTNDNTKVPTGGAVYSLVNATSGGSISAVFTDTDISNSSTANTVTVAATGVGDTSKSARVIFNVIIKDTSGTDNYEKYELEMSRPSGSSVFSFIGTNYPLNNTSITIAGPGQTDGSGSFATRTLIDSFTVYSSTNYSIDFDCVVETDAIFFYLDRVTGTPANWAQMLCTTKVEIIG